MFSVIHLLHSDHIDVVFFRFESMQKRLGQDQVVLSTTARALARVSIERERASRRRSDLLVNRKRRESFIKPLLCVRIQHTTSRRESVVSRPPEDRCGRYWRRSEPEHFRFSSKKLFERDMSATRQGIVGRRWTDPVDVGPVEEESKHLVPE